jgi:hypothetical protein
MKHYEMGRAWSMHEGDKKCLRILVGEPKGNRIFARFRRRLEDYIEMDFSEIGCVCGLDSSVSK